MDGLRASFPHPRTSKTNPDGCRKTPARPWHLSHQNPKCGFRGSLNRCPVLRGWLVFFSGTGRLVVLKGRQKENRIHFGISSKNRRNHFGESPRKRHCMSSGPSRRDISPSVLVPIEVVGRGPSGVRPHDAVRPRGSGRRLGTGPMTDTWVIIFTDSGGVGGIRVRTRLFPFNLP